jgi:hypothetical protein
MKKECSNCHHYKLQPRRIKVISSGILLLFCGYIAAIFPFLQDVGHFMEILAVTLFVIAVFVTGDVCENCKKTYVRKGIER